MQGISCYLPILEGGGGLKYLTPRDKYLFGADDHFAPLRAMSLDPTFQAHELVYCTTCFLPYDQQVNITEVEIPQDAKDRGWYLTNCGHALCSSCLFPNGGITTIPPVLIPKPQATLPKCGLYSDCVRCSPSIHRG